MKTPEKVIVIQGKERKKNEKRIKAKQTRGEKQGKKERNRTNRTCFKRQMLGRELMGLKGRGEFFFKQLVIEGMECMRGIPTLRLTQLLAERQK